MASAYTAQLAPMTRRIEQVSGIRPMTLLVAFGIVLITAILLATGIAANHLRQQALATTESDLGRIDAVLAEAIDRSLAVVDAQLADLAKEARRPGGADGAALPELRGPSGRLPSLSAVALLTEDGRIIAHSAAWPAAVAGGDLVAALRAEPDRVSIIGAPTRDPHSGAVSIPLVRRIDRAQDGAPAAIVGMIPVADFTDFFAAVPLDKDAVFMLLGRDGTMLARYPAQTGSTTEFTKSIDLDTIFADITAIMARHVGGEGGRGWRIEAWRALADHGAAVAVSRDAERALAGWAHQGLWFAAFAFAGALAIGIMVYLIAHQFKTYAALAAIHAEQAIAAIDAEKVEIERARLAAEAELLKAERLSVLGQLTATVAHELRNPLSAIRNTLFTIKELAGNSGIKLDRPVARMERSIERCDRIISDLLEFTRNRELNRKSVCFDRWLAGVLAEQNISPAIGTAMELAAAEATVPIDPDRMRRVVINLFENAAHALAELPADHEKRITARTATEDGELVVTIEDTGPGISPENLARIFEPLFSTKSFGTGLGLPTVKQIVNQHGGTIAVDSEVGRGTRVTVRMPLDSAAVAELKVAA